MLFPRPVTGDANEVRLEGKAGVLLAFVRSVGTVLNMRSTALALRPPSIDVEVLSPGQPVHSNFLGASGNEVELLAAGLCAAVVLACVLGEQLAAEASGLRTDSEAVFGGSVGSPADVLARHLCFLSVFEFPLHHLLGTWRRSYGLDQLEDGTFGLSLAEHIRFG